MVVNQNLFPAYTGQWTKRYHESVPHRWEFKKKVLRNIHVNTASHELRECDLVFTLNDNSMLVERLRTISVLKHEYKTAAEKECVIELFLVLGIDVL